MRFDPLKRRGGFILLEAMIASVVLAVAAVGIASLLLSAHQQQLMIAETNTATLLAKQLMEEIAAKPLGTYPPATGLTSRSQFTTAGEYQGYTDSTATGITTLGGESVPLATDGNYVRTVSISDTSVAQTGAHDIRIVTVTVTTPSGKSVSLSKWLTNVTWAF
jgi:Tfp pilus assembly protein PilV